LEMPSVLEGDITCSDIGLDAATGFANGTLTASEEAAFLSAASGLFVSNGLIPLGTNDDCNGSDWDEISIEVVLSDDCDALATLICTFVAEDVCGNVSEAASTTLTITDNVAPVITCPADVEVSCTDDTSPGSLGMATATDDCGQDVTVDFSDGTVSGTCPEVFTRTWTAVDACGNTSSCDQMITIADEEAPVFDIACQFDFELFTSEGVDCPSDAGFSFAQGDEFPVASSYTIAGVSIPSLLGCVTDNCTANENIIIRAALITEVGDGCSTTFTVDFEALDECGNVGSGFSCNYTITDDVAPELIMSEEPSMHITCMAIDYAMLLDYVDGNLSNTQMSVYESFLAGIFMQNGLTPTEAIDDCNDASFSEIGIEISTDVDCPSKATVRCIFVAVDACGNESESAYTELVVVDNTTPHVFCPANIVVTCGSNTSPEVTGFASATDNCVGIMEVTYEDLYVSAICPSSFIRMWTATDECGNVATCEQMITTVEEGDCVTAPNGLEAEVVGSNSIQFSWNPVPNSVACRVFGRPSGGSANITLGTVIGAEPSGLTFSSNQLQDGLLIEWRVICACELSPLTTSPYSPWTEFYFLTDDNKSNDADNNEGEQLKGELYPNPTRTSVFINSEFEEGDILTVMDLSGKVVGQYNVPIASGLFEINLAELESGVYFIQHSGLNGRSQTFKVVKNN
jgi:hypothetical protein